MQINRKWTASTTFCVMVLSACATTPHSDSLRSALWMQTSAEFKASSIQAYSVARRNLDDALNDNTWNAMLEQGDNFSKRPPAVILDIDETVLDNSRYEAQLIKDGARFNPDTWDAWIALESATAVPGAVEFIQAAREKDIAVIFVTNRPCRRRDADGPECPQEQDTIDNLDQVGVANVAPEDVLLRNEQPEWGSDKQSRREYVAARHRVLMMIGDDLADFLPDVKKNITPGQRDELVRLHSARWGRAWYMLSNPTYGSWLRILEEPKSDYLIGY